MKESFRSTHPITELAINVLYRLIPPGNHPDHQELMKRGLVELSSRLGQPWWSVNFNQIDGPKPHFQRFATLESQMDGLAAYCRDLIEVQGVQPNDIAIVYNGRRVRQLLETQVAASLNSLGVSINSEFPGYRPPHAILVVTANSFKGYDSEVVLVPAIEHFVARDRGILASALYVAMTRARSILALFAQNPIGPYARTINRAVETSLDLLHERPVIADGLSSRDEALHLIEQVGAKHRQWLRDISDQYEVWQEPIISPAGEVIAEPLFWFKTLYGLVACFVPGQPSQRIVHRLSDLGIRRLEIGEPL